MFVVRHVLEDAVLGGRFLQYELRGSDLMVVRTRLEGGSFDDAIGWTPAPRADRWSAVRFTLDSAMLASIGGRATVLQPGDGIAASEWDGAQLRSLEATTDTLRIAWRTDGAFGPKLRHEGRIRLSAASRESLFRLAETLAHGTDDDASRAAFDAIDMVRASGVPVTSDERAGMSVESPASRAFARVLERVLMPLCAQPMAIDLARALDVGERQALRRASEYFRRFHVSVSSWRQYVGGMRLGLSAFFMSQPRARTEHVSRLLGFGSPTSFCHAFQDAGLPSPQTLQRELRAT